MEYFAKMDVQAVRNGLIEKVGGVKHFSILAAIASFADEKGESFPSQKSIAEMVGYSRKTVNEHIKHLRSVRIDDVPVLIATQVITSNGRRNKYNLTEKSGFWFGHTEVTKSGKVVSESGHGNVTPSLQEEEEPRSKKNQTEEDNILFNNARDVMNYFRQQYFTKYSVVYQPNWVREQSMIKNILLTNFTDQQIKTIIDVAVSEYDKRWANPKFPRPSIGQLCTWLANEALAVDAQLKKESENVEKSSKNYELHDDHFEKIMNEII